MPDDLSLAAFVVLAIAALGGAVRMTFIRDQVRAVFWMLEVTVSVAGLLVLLSAEYVAVAYLAVGGGALALLFLFGILLGLRTRSAARRSLDLSFPAAAASAVLGGILAGAALTLRPGAVTSAAAGPTVAQLGDALLSRSALAVEMAGVLLIVVLVGAALWWGGERKR